MSKLSTLLLKFPIIIGATLGFAGAALAVNETPSPEAIEPFSLSPLEIANTPTDSDSDATSQITGVSQLLDSSDTDPMSQVNSVSQFRDVSPRDWAYEALRGLVERYGCIAGYPNGTFRGNRALTRYEFAAGLYSCLTQIERLIAASTADFITQGDLATLERLIQEFEAEIATLGTRVDNLEARSGFLEENQFSTTTKLAGEVIFSLADAFGGPDNALGNDVGENVNTVFHDRVRLNFLTSFTGKDLLQTRLQAGNPGVLLSPATGDPTSPLFGSQEGRFTYDGPNNNDVILDILRYIFPLGDQATVQIIANNGLHHYYADTLNPYFEGRAGGENAISRFAERNPIYRIGPFGAGAAIAYRPFDKVRIDLGYLSNTANDPGDDRGVFGGNYSGIAQVVLGDRYKVGLTYIRGRENNLTSTTPATFSNNRLLLGGTGTALANLNRNALADATTLLPAAFNTTVETDSYGIETSLRFSPKFIVNGWVGYTDANLENVGDAEIWNFAVTLGFPDFGKEGSLLGLVGGAAPTLRDLDIDAGVGAVTGFNRDFAYHIEGFYKYQLRDNISITPGIIWLLNPNQNENNDDVFIGTVRTTFTF